MSNVGEEIKNIYNEIAEKYDAALWYDMPYNKYMDLFVSYLCGKDVLDLGCAMGSFTRYIADKGYNVDGIDFSHKLIEIAKRKVKNVNFSEMDMLDLKLNKKYDGIMSINSIIHIEKKHVPKLLTDINTYLKPDGIFFVILQEGNGEKYVVEPLDTRIKEFVNFYNTDEIETLLKKNGFEIIYKERIRDEAEFELGNDQLVYIMRKITDKDKHIA